MYCITLPSLYDTGCRLNKRGMYEGPLAGDIESRSVGEEMVVTRFDLTHK